jgi:beta-lactamase class A
MKLNLPKRISILQLFIAVILTALTTGFITSKNHSTNVSYNDETSKSNNLCNYSIKRLQEYKFIKPLMFVDDECQSDRLSSLKSDIQLIIERYKSSQNINSASVYLKEFEYNEWIAINETEKYEPGSLFKVPLLIAILKMDELNPGFLNKKVRFDSEFNLDKKVAFNDKHIKIGNEYTIKELLDYMIIYSDNNATGLLQSHMDGNVLIQLFKDLNIEIPNKYKQQYFFNVVDYTLFLRAIYNASYLTIKNSEYAAELLEKTNFKEGFVKGIPSGVLIAHKFGESGNVSEMQLHESGIIYLDQKPFILTVMIKGKDNNSMTKLLQEISATAYNSLKNEVNNSI